MSLKNMKYIKISAFQEVCDSHKKSFNKLVICDDDFNKV